MKNYISLLFVSVITFISYSQRNFTLGDLKTPYSYRVNPAIMPESKIFIAIPVLGSENFQFTNRIAPINKLFVKNDRNLYDINSSNSFLNGLSKNPDLGIDMTNQIIAFGFKVKKNYFYFDINNKFNSQIGFGSDFLKFLAQGNGGDLLGKRASFDGLGANLMDYVEYGLGFSREWNDKLNVGARIKFLSGVANVKGNNTLGLFTNAVNNDLTIDGSANINSSNSLAFTDSAYAANNNPSQIISSLFNFSNAGFGFDFGGTYKYSDKITFNASVIDLGFIKWNSNIGNYNINKFTYSFTGIDLSNLSDSIDVGQKMTDSLTKIFKVARTSESYFTGLPTKIYLGASYKWNDYLSSGATFYQEIFNSTYRPGLVISSTFSYKHWLGATLNYGIYAGSAANVGFGLRLRGFYILTDNLLAAVNYQAIKAASVALGFNITIGNRHETKASAKS